MKSSESLYTQLTDRRISLDERLTLVENAWRNHSKQMLFDWLSGLMINRKKSGIDSVELIHRIWGQLSFCLKNSSHDQVTIKPSFIKSIIDALSNENGESNSSVIECCLLISRNGKDLDYKYDQLVSLLLIVLTKYKENEELLTILLNKYSTTIRVQGNINKVFQDLSKQFLVLFLEIRLIYPSLTDLIDQILKHVIFHRTWTSAYREFIESVSMKKSIVCPVSSLFVTLETSIVVSANENVVRFLPSVFRHCINLIEQSVISQIFDLLVQINTWLLKIPDSNVFYVGIGQLLKVLEEKHVFDQILNESNEEQVSNWMKEILFSRNVDVPSESYGEFVLTCLHLNSTLIESNLQKLIEILQLSSKALNIFLIGYVDLYAQMRSLAKLTKRLTQTFDTSFRFSTDVLQNYRKRISECTHTLVDEIWSSLLDYPTKHLIIIDLLSALLEGYRLFDLNIPRAVLLQQTQTKYDRTLEKLRLYANDSKFVNDVQTRSAVIKCYLSLGWFSLCLLSFSSTIPPVNDRLNHNGPFLSVEQWNSIESDVELRPILFSLSCQRFSRLLMSNETPVDSIENFSTSSSNFDEFETFFDYLPANQQMKFVENSLRQFDSDRLSFISNENRLKLFVQSCVEHLINEKSSKKRKKIDWNDDDDAENFYEFLRNKSVFSSNFIDLFSSVYFDRVHSMKILVSIGWLALNGESAQILVDLLRSTSKLPSNFVEDLLRFALDKNQSKMFEEILPIFIREENYRSILKKRIDEFVAEMKTNDDAKNVRFFEKFHRVLSQSRILICQDDFCSIIDRLIDSSSNSTISYSILDTRYLLAMIILNCLKKPTKYLSFLHQTWKSLIAESNQGEHLKPVVIAFANHWQKVIGEFDPLENLQIFLKFLDDRFDLISNVIESIDDEKFRFWLDRRVESCRTELEFDLIERLAQCSLNKDSQIYFDTILNNMLSECGPILIRFSIDSSRFEQIVSIILNFSIRILTIKRSQIRSQVAISLLQCLLQLPSSILFVLHSKVCKLVSILMKNHSKTLTKHVAVVETILKLLLQSIVDRAKEQEENEENLVEAARETTTLASHLIEQFKDDFRSTIVYVLIDYVHLLSKSRNLSADLKKNLHGTAFELFRISGERVEQYSGQMSIGERELLKQLQQQYKQYHMFKGTV